MSSTQNLLGGRYQPIHPLNTHVAGQTLLANDIQDLDHTQCVVRQLRFPTRNPMTRQFILGLLKKKVQVLKEIGQHPQIPATTAAFNDDQSFYIVQEFIPGRSLREELASAQPWSAADARAFLRAVLPVLAHAQKRGVVHGNLKPSKLIRHQAADQFVILDFGGIKSVSQNIAYKKKSFVPVPQLAPAQAYLAPEQWRRQTRFCSDHYALGMMVIQALTGLPPEALPTAQEPTLQTDIVGLLTAIPDLDAPTSLLLTRMVHPNPEQRYQAATDILADLDQLQSSQSAFPELVTQAPVPLSISHGDDSPPIRTQKWPWGLISVVGLVGLAGVTGLMALRLPQRVLAGQQLQTGQDLEADDPEAALARYNRALELQPLYPEALAERGQLHLTMGDTEAALADLTEAIALAPEQSTYPYDRANIRLSVGDIQGAINDYTQALQQDAQFVKAYVNRGSARAEWGDDQGAIEDYTQAIELASGTEILAAAHLNRCLSYSNLGEQSAALDDCAAAINLRPSHALAYQNRGLVRRRSMDYQGSLQDYNIAIQIEPNSPDPYYNRGLTRQALNDLTGAMADFSQAIALDPNYVFAMYDRGLLQAELGNHAAALADLRQASQLCLDLGRTGCYDDAQYQITRLQAALPVAKSESN
ncbi:MAG: protein kinase family protein [Cyanobacteria bacterium J06626_4]